MPFDGGGTEDDRWLREREESRGFRGREESRGFRGREESRELLFFVLAIAEKYELDQQKKGLRLNISLVAMRKRNSPSSIEVAICLSMDGVHHFTTPYIYSIISFRLHSDTVSALIYIRKLNRILPAVD